MKNSSSGTVTNLDGHYSLTIEGIGGVLEFSYIGMKKQEIAISNKNIIDVILNPDTKKLVSGHKHRLDWRTDLFFCNPDRISVYFIIELRSGIL